ncbi:MAG: flagellar motor switch protein FliN, partial [Armatimonadota bacterium]
MALSNAPGEPRKLDILLDVPLEISVELGRVKMTVREIVDLGTGSIVEVDRSAGEPVDVMVNGRRVARGEVVVIEDNFGVRITEILDPNQRV